MSCSSTYQGQNVRHHVLRLLARAARREAEVKSRLRHVVRVRNLVREPELVLLLGLRAAEEAPVDDETRVDALLHRAVTERRQGH